VQRGRQKRGASLGIPHARRSTTIVYVVEVIATAWVYSFMPTAFDRFYHTLLKLVGSGRGKIKFDSQ
jgi:hypothetical protein